MVYIYIYILLKLIETNYEFKADLLGDYSNLLCLISISLNFLLCCFVLVPFGKLDTKSQFQRQPKYPPRGGDPGWDPPNGYCYNSQLGGSSQRYCEDRQDDHWLSITCYTGDDPPSELGNTLPTTASNRCNRSLVNRQGIYPKRFLFPCFRLKKTHTTTNA